MKERCHLGKTQQAKDIEDLRYSRRLRLSIGKPLQADLGCVSTSLSIYEGTLRNMPEDLNFQHYHCQNLIGVRKYTESEGGT